MGGYASRRRPGDAGRRDQQLGRLPQVPDQRRHHKPIRTSDERVVLRAAVRQQRRNLVEIGVRIFDGAGTLCTEATCLYFLFPKERARTEFHFCDCGVADEETDPLQ